MKPGSVFVMCSTVDPNWSIALEARLQAMGVEIDALTLEQEAYLRSWNEGT